MSEVIDAAVTAMNEKMSDGFDGVAKFVLRGEGSIMLDRNGAREGDEEADVTLTADADVFRRIFEGDLNPTGAFMTGKLSVDGNMGMAMKLASVIG
jgi:putative sterol carrier protein